MLIDVIHKQAEQKLLSSIENGGQRHTSRGALYFHCAELERKPQETDMLLIVRPLLQDNHTAIYFLHDGDLAIAWNGVQKAVLDDLCKRLYTHFHLNGNEALHKYYDFNAHGEDLRLLLRDKLKSLPKELPTRDNGHSSDVFIPVFTNAQLQHIKRYGAERRTFKAPTMLIVEDQDFSRKLLEGMLNKAYVSYSASNAEQAIGLYAEHIPCIAFLDIELPDINGHDLAAFLKRHDPESFIVMVTANNYEKDVKRALENKVQGFIAKPYSKQKILEHVEKYIRQHRQKP